MKALLPIACVLLVQFPLGGGFGKLNAPKQPAAPPIPHPQPPVVLPLLPPRQGDPKMWRQEQGSYPTVFPQPADVRLDDVRVHADEVGGCDQTLRALSAAPNGGYAAVWNDSRNGNLGLFLGLLDEKGQRTSEDWPVNPPFTSRQFEPALALGATRRGAVAWFSTSFGYNGVRLRFFNGVNGFIGPDIALGLLQPRAGEPGGGAAPAGAAEPAGGARRDAPGAARDAAAPTPAAGAATEAQQGGARDGAPRAAPGPAAGRNAGGGRAAAPGAQSLPSRRLPGVVMNPGGDGAAVWADGGSVWLQAFRTPEDCGRPPQQVNPEGPQASGAVQVAQSPSGALLIAWTAPSGIALVARDPAGALSTVPGGNGALAKLVADPLGGYWALVAHADRWFLRHYGEAGGVDREDLLPVNEACTSADFALARGGTTIAFLVERPDRPQPLELRALAPNGQPFTAEPWRFPTLDGERARPGITSPRIAARGADVLVAWSDARSGNLDVWGALVSAGSVGAEQRLNQDGPSAYQTSGGIASNGSHAIAVWQDERFGAPRVLARRIGADAQLAAREIALDGELAPGGARQQSPNVAMDANGAFAAAWWEVGPDAAHLKVRVYAPDGTPVAASLELDPAQDGEALFTPALAALPQSRGFAVMWVRKNGSPAVARVTLAGRIETPAVGLGPARAAQSRNPYLCTLSDGRLVALWDSRNPEGVIALHGMFLRSDCVPEGTELAFPASPQGGDHDACAVATPGGGFLMAWTGNEGPERDVFARAYDRGGAPTSLPLPVSVRSNEQDFAALCALADGSYLVVWEDDISGRDHCVARRIAADCKTMGPTVTVNQRATSYVEDRTHPYVCALGDGWAAIFDDRRRSLGMDVYLRVLGNGFDKLPPPAAPRRERP